MKVVKCTSKGQVTIPAEVRAALGITEDSCLEVSTVGDEVRMRKLVAVRPLGGDDPIWELVGVGASGASDVAESHDQYLADAERGRWHESS
jgi:AbrB family looped-hinge helix DNA binding protein